MGLKVIGAGFGRTGTGSLKAALEELGIGKCYHMSEVVKNFGHMRKWVDIIENSNADWADLFEGYQAAVDWPAAVYYKALMVAYPDAKVILTVRDPERWHESVMNTIYQLSTKFSRFVRFIPPLNRFFKALEKALWVGTFNNRLVEKAYAVEVFKDHIEEVKRTVPVDRLLIFESGQGWEPLCEFLDLPIPDTPYPHVNKGGRIKRLFRIPPYTGPKQS